MADSHERIKAQEEAHDFRESAEAISPSIWRCLRRFGVPAADVEDHLQAVLIQLYGRWERLGLLPTAQLRSYACVVAIGVARGAARKRQRTGTSTTFADDIAAEGTPETQAVRQEELEQLDAVLATLDEERREVFVLYELEGLTGPEIAELLDLPVGTVASRLRRARADFEAAVARSLAEARRKRP